MAFISGTSGNDIIHAHAGAAGTLVIIASGTPAEGIWPTFNVLVNGVVVLSNVSVTANNSTGATQTISVPVSAGATSVSIDYTNDVQTSYSTTEDRNLFLSSVSLNGTVLPFSSAVYTRDGGSAVGGQGAMVWGGELTYSGSVVTNAMAGTGSFENATIDAGAGLDLVVYQGNASNYNVVASSGGFTITSSAYSDSLINVERLAFDNVRIALDINGNAGMAYRLYQAAFDRTPDLPGLGFQMTAMDNGWPLWSIAKDFVNSPEFSATYGALTNEQFVTQLYRNVLNREPDQAGLAYHVNNLNTTHTRGDVLAGFSESPENQANVIGAIQNGMFYIV